MPFRIGLNAGHGLKTVGKRCTKALDPNMTREWVLNSRIAEGVEARLSEYEGYELLRTDDRTGKIDVSSKKRINAAAEFGADLYLSLHHNASKEPIISGGGIVAYVVVNPTESSLEWQRALYDALIDSTGLKGNRATPLAQANLYELKLAKAESIPTAVLLELGFMTSSADVPVILTEEYADKCAAAIVKVIAERANLTEKTASAPAAGDAAEDAAKEETVYCVQIGSFNSEKKAVDLCNEVAVAGFDAYVNRIGNKHKVQVGQCPDLSSANDLEDALTIAGYEGYITTIQTGDLNEPTEIVPMKIKVGDSVKLKKGATNYAGVKLKSYVYERTHKVKSIAGDRVVITYYGIVAAAVRLDDLILV